MYIVVLPYELQMTTSMDAVSVMPGKKRIAHASASEVGLAYFCMSVPQVL